MSLRLALLGMLAYGERSGYDVVREFDAVFSHVWQASQAQIYGELRRLAGAGLIAEAERQPRNRRPYRLTDDGLAALTAQLTETAPDHSQRNESLLRAFFLWTIPPDAVSAYLDAEERFHRDRLAQLENLVTAGPARTRAERAARLAAQAGVYRLRAMLEWIEHARADISDWPPQG